MDWICFNRFEALHWFDYLIKDYCRPPYGIMMLQILQAPLDFLGHKGLVAGLLELQCGTIREPSLLWALFGTGYFSCHLQNELEQDTQRWKILSSTSKLADQVLCLITGRRWKEELSVRTFYHSPHWRNCLDVSQATWPLSNFTEVAGSCNFKGFNSKPPRTSKMFPRYLEGIAPSSPLGPISRMSSVDQHNSHWMVWCG